MTPKEFQKRVGRFVTEVAGEFVADATVVFWGSSGNPDQMRADINLTDRIGDLFGWTVPVGVDSDKICILVPGDAGYRFPLDPEGFYLYLWMDARNKIAGRDKMIESFSKEMECRMLRGEIDK